MKTLIFIVIAALILFFTGEPYAAKKPSYEGYKKCGGCHKSQKDSWLQTGHAEAFEALMPGKHVDEKKKAKLDPQKDYTKDEKCIGCHVTGYNGPGGYREGLSETKAKYLRDVGCEACHGPGSLYRKDHSKAGAKFKKMSEKSPRKALVDLGQNFEYSEACNSCHMNYKDSPWKGAKEPYTPFTPELDKKYRFDFDKAVRQTGKGKAMHEHFKLRGVYEGAPEPKLREELQKRAKEPAAAEEGAEEEE